MSFTSLLLVKPFQNANQRIRTKPQYFLLEGICYIASQPQLKFLTAQSHSVRNNGKKRKANKLTNCTLL